MPRQHDPRTVPPLTLSDDELYTRVARKAYELYQARGEEPGDDVEDWLTAERLVKAELLHGPASESDEPPLDEP
ncbi:MAG: DUF2934 domain-containing protein [Deltaproteobacteria bacterium]|nr:DUF2934 domain-containing protein [Deltaproteobacteria bacterium]